jgi:V/A-type H+-transporting ATPase subunit I
MQIDWLNNQNHIMALCFLIGAVHMTIAHVWRILTLLGSKKALEQVGWIYVVWAMFFLARDLVAGVEAPGFTIVMLVAGIVLIALFMATLEELKTEWINLAMLPLSIVSALVDVISYIRLFAVGMASLAVAQSFNDMAIGIGFGNVFAAFGAAVILFFGHLLNIILCGLAVLVHGVRLNTLEFSMHMNMEWSGVPYTPFARANPQRTE